MDLQGYVGVAASGTDQKWRVGKINGERWKDGGRLEMERFVPPWCFVLLLASGLGLWSWLFMSGFELSLKESILTVAPSISILGYRLLLIAFYVPRTTLMILTIDLRHPCLKFPFALAGESI